MGAQHFRQTLAVVAFLGWMALPGWAETVEVATSEQLAAAIASAGPGTTIRIAPGRYRGGLSKDALAGTKDQPIVLAGADPKNRPVIEGGASGLHLSSPAFVEIRDLEFERARGNGINIDDGGSSAKAAHDVVLRNLAVRDVGPEGNRDGIKLSGLNDFRVEGCTLARWGKSGSAIDMVGCQRGVVAGCTFREGADGANGVQTKGGSRDIAIERCRFENAGGRAINAGGSTGLDYFRPSIGTFEAKDITVRDCEIIGGLSAIAFVGVDGALVEHNTIYGATRWPLRILQENTDERFVPSRRGVFKKNFVVFRAEQIRQMVNIGSKTSPETFIFEGNQWHAIDRPADTRRFVSLPVKETGGIYDREPKFRDAERGDVRLTERTADDAGVRDEPGK
jgi:hypothetical protein